MIRLPLEVVSSSSPLELAVTTPFSLGPKNLVRIFTLRDNGVHYDCVKLLLITICVSIMECQLGQNSILHNYIDCWHYIAYTCVTMCMCMSIYVYLYMYMCNCICMMYKDLCIHVCIGVMYYKCIYVCVCMCDCSLYVCLHESVHVCVCV